LPAGSVEDEEKYGHRGRRFEHAEGERGRHTLKISGGKTENGSEAKIPRTFSVMLWSFLQK